MRVALGITNFRHDRAVRQIIAALLLLVFAGANYAVQTHIHDAYAGVAAAANLSAPAPAAPADKDSRHCPLCQEFLSGGNFLPPVTPVLAPPVLIGFAVLAPAARVAAGGAPHDWQSRGPPPR